MSNRESITGTCLCKAVRFTASLPSLWSAHCHCSMCRRAHGAPFVTWVGVKRETFRVTEGEDVMVDFESSPGTLRSFCGRCGTPMLFRSPRWADEVHIARACFEDELDRPVQAHVHFDDRVPWVDIRDDLPRRGGIATTPSDAQKKD